LNKIIQRASEDLLFAKTVFENKSVEEIEKYNCNWHMKNGYSVDNFLFNLYMQEKLFEVCKRKFDYECNSSNMYIPLNLSNNEEHKHIFQQLRNILVLYPLNNGYEKRFDLSGRIMKYFTSCCDYHCQEILRNVQSGDFLIPARKILLNAPILWIVDSLKNAIRENIGSLSDFNLAEHIQINWDRTQNFETNDDETELFDSIYIDEENKANEILSELKKQWKISYNRIDGEIYSIKFRSYKQFDKFRKYALHLSKPYYIFEGEVLDIVNHYDYANGIVEIKLERIFDIPNTLAKILGIRIDY
jgi:serine/threonine-protein kinase